MSRTFHPPPHVAISRVGKASARTGRNAVMELLQGATFAEWHADAALVVSELVANALTECGECRLAAWYLADFAALRVEVIDSSQNLPVPQVASSARVGGHGLRVVEALSTRSGVTTTAESKTVWFEIDG